MTSSPLDQGAPRASSRASSNTSLSTTAATKTATVGGAAAVGAVLRVDDPVLRDALLLFGVLSLAACRYFRAPNTVVAVACVLLLAGFSLPHWRQRVRVENCGSSLSIRGWSRRLALNASNILDMRQNAQMLSILLSDGRLLHVLGAPPSALAALVAGFWSGPSSALLVRLRGLPAATRASRLFSRFFPLSLWFRPELSVTEDCVSVRLLFWTKRIPLSRIVRLRVLGHGIELGFADSSTLELCTFAGLSSRWNGRVYDYNELICSFLQVARARALSRFLTGYRGGGAGVEARRVSNG